jgi:outer membrane usher protein
MQAAQEPLVVRISINSVPKGDFFVFRTSAGDFYLKADDLKTMGISAEGAGPPVQLDGEAHLSLRSLPGVTFSFNVARAELEITADARLLPRRVYDLSGKAKATGIVPRGSSAFFNYALNYENGDNYARPRMGFTAEAGARRGDALLLSNGATIERGDGSRKFVRLMSSLMWDDRQKLQRTVVGDFYTPARDFSVGANVGGISFSKLYDINPYLVHYPTQTIRGNVALPSDLEVYVDGQRVRTERLSPGEYELRDLTGYQGARSVQLVLRDSFGRVQQLSYAFYVSDQPLREGFHEYSYNLGALRRSFGSESSRYGTPAYSMFHRVGLTDAITLGLRAEGTGEFFNAGPSATVVLGSAGVLNAAFARSSVRGWGGSAATVSYSYEGTNWSVGAGVRREWDTFTVLGEPLSATNRRVEANITASVHLGRSGSASLSHHKLRVNDASRNPPASAPFAFSALTARRETSLTYSLPLVSGKSSLNTSVRHIKDASGSRNEVFVGLLYFPDRDHIVNTSVRAASDNSHSESLQFSKNQPYGEGLGYTVSADRSSTSAGHSTQLRSSAQYNASAFLVRGELNQTRAGGGSSTEHRLAVAGGIGYAGERISFGRPITDSFALVKVGEIPGVAVTVNGLDAGRTNTRGEVFVPNLRAYYDNEIALNAPDIPIEQSIETLKARVSPSLRSGALLSFAPTKVQAISGKLLLVRSGSPVPLENQLVAFTVQDKRHNFRTGRSGEFYVENIPAGRYPAEATTPEGRCRFELLIPQSSEVFLELPDQLCQASR